ncbi:hypothetical protein C5167_022365 [Papaver somniferum]|uniref:J domain-containing protein n=1 Tax=Papaver somniferum TaxID=3469 RepID=A0A4Y7JLI4_PAPSO|nr:uncharacterized protein LOC113281460 [Papaver somniferum]RZC60609.1 hypothetical protein C5167_022365 [Papaver somniferum]
MECNRDEAARAKQIAEKKFSAKDIAGAKKFATKAQNLYPGLEGISHMLSTFDVYLSAENKVYGEADWYGILGVSPYSDEETVKKQYRKLALLLHPDKNKSVGADGAFKLISEAWSLLSDKTKRAAYDQKRFPPRTSHHKVPTTTRGSSFTAANGFTDNKSSEVRSHKSTTHAGPTTVPAPAPLRPSKPNTFWTSCNRCKMQYEYLRVYLNHNLLCPNCHEPFLAIEAPNPPTNGSNSSTSWSFSQQHQKQNNQTDIHFGPAADIGTAANMAQQAYEKLKRERDEAQAAAVRRQEALGKKKTVSKRPVSGSGQDLQGGKPAKKTKIIDGGNYYGGNMADQVAFGSGGGNYNTSGFQPGCSTSGWPNGFYYTSKPNSTKDLTQLELRNMLVEKSKREIRKKLSEWSLSSANKAQETGGKKEEEKQKQKQPFPVHGDTLDEKKSVELDTKKAVQDMKVTRDASSVDTEGKTHESLVISVPDPDFHDFDKDRSEKSFGENQVWAAYDNDDGMPRYYAMVQKVISRSPFKMRMSWLNGKSCSELGPIDWVGLGFSKTCGDFRVGRYELNKSVNFFSHRVTWTKGVRGAVRIVPRKGDIWALYCNWSSDWDGSTPEEVIHKYEMVEVLDDFDEEQGITVTPLVKVAGFKTVFHRHLDPGEARRIPREEMFRFSHQVPSYMLTGEEAQNAPKGCHELDPAATPVELLQVMTEAKKEENAIYAEVDIRVETEKEVKIAESRTKPGSRKENVAESPEGKPT